MKYDKLTGMSDHKKCIAVLGSTGSIGLSSLDVIESLGDDFQLISVGARRQWRLLARQARRFNLLKVVITDIYAASEKPIPGISGKTIADGIKGRDVLYVPKKEGIVEHLMQDIKPGDLIMTLGAGDIYTVGKEILARLKLNK